MNITIPDNFKEVQKSSFNSIKGMVQYFRDGRCGGIEYHLSHTKNDNSLFAIEADNGKYYVRPECLQWVGQPIPITEVVREDVKLNIKDGDVLVLRGMNQDDFNQYAIGVQKYLIERNCRNVLIIALKENQLIESLDEKEMNIHGWFRKNDGRDMKAFDFMKKL